MTTLEEIRALEKALGYKEFPYELIHNAEATRQSIKILKLLLNLQTGKFVPSKDGLLNKFKIYVLGYAYAEEKEI